MISTNWGAATDTGLVRHENQDAFFAQMPIFVVADGMGGHAGGALASSLAVEEFQSLQASGGPPTVEAIAHAIDGANRRIRAQATAVSGAEGMGTTVVGLALVSDRDQDLWLVFNIGDSRLYRLSEGALIQITTDHSEVQELVEAGAITVEAARHHPERNVITRAVGVSADVAPDFWLRPPETGERFLLSTDGLTGEIDDDDIRQVLVDETDPSVAALRLVERAISAGGHDNVTAVVVDVLNVNDRPGEDEGDTARSRPTQSDDAPDASGGGDEPKPQVLIDTVPVTPGSSGGEAGSRSGAPLVTPREMIDQVPVDASFSQDGATGGPDGGQEP